MSCHLTEVSVQGKTISQPLSMQTLACALQLLSFAPKVISVATPRISNIQTLRFLFSLSPCNSEIIMMRLVPWVQSTCIEHRSSKE